MSINKSKYISFISYSHVDVKYATQLQEAIEKFEFPRTRGASRTLPLTKVGKVFRDQSDLGAASQLSAKIESALRDSYSLIVLCSTAAAQSDWVNKEIEFFKSTGQRNRIFAVIVNGEPRASDRSLECFPDALLGNAKDKFSGPLAVDIRKYSRSDLVRRLIAGIFEIDYDDLKRRDLKRQRRANLLRYAAAALGAIILFGSLYYFRNGIARELSTYGYFAELSSTSDVKADLSSKIDSNLSEVRKNLRQKLSVELEKELIQRNPQAAWSVSQYAVALEPNNQNVKNSIIDLMEDNSLNQPECWPEFVVDYTCHVVATSWVIFAQTMMNLRSNDQAISALLDLQSADGYWPLYFNSPNKHQDASVHATAWALLALSRIKNAKSHRLSEIKRARKKAADWLIQSANEDKVSWRDYPFNDRGVELASISALAIVALNEDASAPELNDINRKWLRALPLPTEANSLEISNVELDTIDGTWIHDKTRYTIAPWMVLGIIAAIDDADRLGRARAMHYLNSWNNSLSQMDALTTRGFVAAESLISINMIEKWCTK